MKHGIQRHDVDQSALVADIRYGTWAKLAQREQKKSMYMSRLFVFTLGIFSIRVRPHK